MIYTFLTTTNWAQKKKCLE